MTQRADPMLEALHTEKPHESIASELQVYGRFVGSWKIDVDLFPFNRPPLQGEGEWHFAWVIEGRAIQDVFIFPARHLWNKAEPWHRYGTTFRWYDPAIDAWHITYFDPSRSFEQRQLGRPVGNDIVQIGEDSKGVQRRWRFTEITNQSFRWIGEVSWDKGAHWTLELKMNAGRTSAQPSQELLA